DACAAALDGLALYPDSNAFELKYSLSQHLDVSPECITLGNGSNNLLDLIAQVFLNDQSSAVFSEYAFVVYPLATKIANATQIVVPASDWGHDLTAMAAAIQDDTRLVFLANPNNPTGTYFSHNELVTFLDAVPEHVIVVLDEAYYEYCHNLADYPDGLTLQKTHPNLVVSRTFSKAYGLAGLRVGYMVSHPDVADLLNRVRAPFNVNSMALVGAQAALSDKMFLKDSQEVNRLGLAQLTSAFDSMSVPFIPSVGNFMCIEVGDGAVVYQALLEKGVIVRPLNVYSMPRHVRVSVGLKDENAFFLTQLKSVL
ncbi:MAG: histidinol-phosphate transaminase, partial [Pseudomonadota bacterium]